MRVNCCVPFRNSLALIIALAFGMAAEAADLTVQIIAPTHGQHLSKTARILVSAEDPEGVTYVALYKDGAVIATDFTVPYECSWQTQAEAEGPHTLMAKAVGKRLRETTTARLTVTVDNTPPTITLAAPPDQATAVGITTLDAQAADALGLQAVQFFLNGTKLSTVIQPPYRFDWDTNTIPNGHQTLQARAVDQAGNDATSEMITVWVANPNDPPVLTPPPPTTVLEGAVWTLQLKATEPNAPRDPITYSADKLPAWATLDPQTGRLSGTPSFEEASHDKPLVPYLGLVVRACDPEPLCAEQPFALSVMNANRQPTLTPLGPQTVEEDGWLVIHLAGSDPDGDALLCRIRQLPPWMKFDADRCLARGQATDEIEPLTEPETVYPEVLAEVCDQDGACAKETFMVTVTGVGNQPPKLTAPPITTIEEGKRLTWEVEADDPEQETVVLTAEPLPDGATFIDHTDNTGLFSWTPRYDQRGTYDFTVKASDKEKNAVQKVRVVVKEAGLAISGLITTVEGAPVDGAVLEVETSKAFIRNATTDAKGYYLVSGLPPGAYFLTPRYELKTAFSAVARSQVGVSFSPPRIRVVLTDGDQTATDFTATFP